MTFTDDLFTHSEQISIRLPHIKGEEATKHALVVPFIQLLGYNVFDPREVKPEYIADFAKKSRGQFEKIDYAIYKNNKTILFVECKSIDEKLNDHDGQLSRYFNATPSVTVAILTNGIRFQAYTDLLYPNIMDSTPFLDLDLTNLNNFDIEALNVFHKDNVSTENLLTLAEETVCLNSFNLSSLVNFISLQLQNPSPSFVKYVIGEIQSTSRITQRITDIATPILQQAIQISVNKIGNIGNTPIELSLEINDNSADIETAAPTLSKDKKDGVITTETELRCLSLIENYCHSDYPDIQITGRDSKSYFTVHQNNVRKWFVRFNLQKPPFWISFRHIEPDEIKNSLKDIRVIEGGMFGNSKVSLTDIDSVAILKPFIILACEREMRRIEQDEMQSKVPSSVEDSIIMPIATKMFCTQCGVPRIYGAQFCVNCCYELVSLA